ncbi:alpha/beta hydrolase [Sphingomonas bacterium]|uniref:alpha/beta hydrolase n=1 Tax=Sphingomonas bacterium TaxID=1895847 RepID=UPI002615C1E4|nr:alpha/beta hydrolase [Sphingomonas bacterium]MDB5677451.1 hypothetical protein [Sphingomonas bacterium]
MRHRDKLRRADLDLRDLDNEVANEPRSTQRFQFARHRRILLIHGCNTNERDGQKRTAPLREALVQRCPSLDAQVLTVTWPGDFAWSRGGLAAYKQMTKRADQAGAKLWEVLDAEFDHALGAPELVVVAHSLGCRLALQMIARLAPSPHNTKIRKLVLILMGAAVATDRHDLFALARGHAEVVVLYSDRDRALGHAFPLGQVMAGEGASEAIGLHGNPREPAWASTKLMEGYDHEHYWPDVRTVDAVVESLTQFNDLAFRGDPAREHVLPVAGPGPEADELPQHSLFAR